MSRGLAIILPTAVLPSLLVIRDPLRDLLAHVAEPVRPVRGRGFGVTVVVRHSSALVLRWTTPAEIPRGLLTVVVAVSGGTADVPERLVLVVVVVVAVVLVVVETVVVLGLVAAVLVVAVLAVATVVAWSVALVVLGLAVVALRAACFASVHDWIGWLVVILVCTCRCCRVRGLVAANNGGDDGCGDGDWGVGHQRGGRSDRRRSRDRYARRSSNGDRCISANAEGIGRSRHQRRYTGDGCDHRD